MTDAKTIKPRGILTLLRKARKVLAKRKAWRQGRLRGWKEEYCLMGALIRASGHTLHEGESGTGSPYVKDDPRLAQAVAYLRPHLYRNPGPTTEVDCDPELVADAIITFNDFDYRRHGAVLAALDRAINSAEAGRVIKCKTKEA